MDPVLDVYRLGLLLARLDFLDKHDIRAILTDVTIHDSLCYCAPVLLHGCRIPEFVFDPLVAQIDDAVVIVGKV